MKKRRKDTNDAFRIGTFKSKIQDGPLVHFTCVLSAITVCISAQCYSLMNWYVAIIEGLNTRQILS